MLDNLKSLLIFGYSKEEIEKLENSYSTIVISNEMANMKLKEIIEGFKFESNEKELPREKVVILNNFSDKELPEIIKLIKSIDPETILAVVTPTSINWTFNDLLEHLIEEREWYKKRKKGRS